MKKKAENGIQDLAKEAQKHTEPMYDFELLLDKSKGLDDKKRMLWKQIYRNAVEDRSTASSLFNSAYESVGQSAQDHLAMGPTLVKYLEKMSKSNQQLLDLSSLMTKDDEQNSRIDPDDLFKRIEEQNGD